MRLNRNAIVCPGCRISTNPFIVVNSLGNRDKEVQCPNCSELFTIRCDKLDHINGWIIPHWIALPGTGK